MQYLSIPALFLIRSFLQQTFSEKPVQLEDRCVLRLAAPHSYNVFRDGIQYKNILWQLGETKGASDLYVGSGEITVFAFTQNLHLYM